jgi:hypothetical protein
MTFLAAIMVLVVIVVAAILAHAAIMGLVAASRIPTIVDWCRICRGVMFAAILLIVPPRRVFLFTVPVSVSWGGVRLHFVMMTAVAMAAVVMASVTMAAMVMMLVKRRAFILIFIAFAALSFMVAFITLTSYQVSAFAVWVTTCRHIGAAAAQLQDEEE